jgi:hypothetical protein
MSLSVDTNFRRLRLMLILLLCLCAVWTWPVLPMFHLQAYEWLCTCRFVSKKPTGRRVVGWYPVWSCRNSRQQNVIKTALLKVTDGTKTHRQMMFAGYHRYKCSPSAVLVLFSFSGWGETEFTWYVGHCYAIVPAPDDR